MSNNSKHIKNNDHSEEKLDKEQKYIKPESEVLDAKYKDLSEKAKLAEEYLDQLKHLQADFENYRKRTAKEKEEFKKFVLEDFTYELLNVLDNIQRAISVSEEKHNYDSLVNGISIVEKQFLELLKTKNVIPINIKLGDNFDPSIHNAVAHEPSEKYAVDTVINILQQGYKINGRTLRPAMVIVSSGRDKEKQQVKENKDQNQKINN